MAVTPSDQITGSMKTLPLILSLFLVCLSFSGWSQRLEKFSENQDEFIAELGNYMTSSKQKVLEDNYREFQSVFKAGMFTEDEEKRILQTANSMLSVRMQANPFFRDYLKIVILIKRQENGSELFTKWHKVFDELLAQMDVSHKRPFQEFLGFAADLSWICHGLRGFAQDFHGFGTGLPWTCDGIPTDLP